MTSFRINGIFITMFFLWASWINPVMLTAQVTPGDDIMRSASFLLGNAIQPSREGRHHLLLRSLRQLRDPALDPLYQHLLDSDSPSLKIHGFLGLLESSPPGKADLSSLAAVKDERLAAEMVNAMMDNELLTLEQARQILSWRDFDPASELLVASYLLEKGQFDQPDRVLELAKLPAPPVRGLAGLLLTQMNHAQGITLLEELRQSEDPRRDILLETLCRAALRQKFDKTAHWGMTIATDPKGSARTSLAGLQLAMRFNAPGAYDFWKGSFLGNMDLAQQTRLALLALELSPWITADVAKPLVEHSDPLIVQVGHTVQAVAGVGDLAAAMEKLIAMQHPLASDWAVRYARKEAPLSAVQPIVEAVLKAYEGPARNQAQRFEDVVAAVQVLIERQPAQAKAILQPRLAMQPGSKSMQQAILLGLIRSRTQDGFNPADVLEGLPAFGHPAVASLAELLEAKHSPTLSQAQMESLGTMVRGGGELPETLRLQAAWIWLKHAGQAQRVLSEVTARG